MLRCPPHRTPQGKVEGGKARTRHQRHQGWVGWLEAEPANWGAWKSVGGRRAGESMTRASVARRGHPRQHLPRRQTVLKQQDECGLISARLCSLAASVCDAVIAACHAASGQQTAWQASRHSSQGFHWMPQLADLIAQLLNLQIGQMKSPLRIGP